MTKTQVSCPNCRQPVVADVDQLFDVNVDPSAKQRLLSGSFNLIQCKTCGYQGNLSTILVYHDPEKELLLTFVPPEIGLPRNEQESGHWRLDQPGDQQAPPGEAQRLFAQPASYADHARVGRARIGRGWHHT